MVNLSGSFERNGCTIRYVDSGGSGQAVVLTHGAGADHQMFDHQARELAQQGYRVVTWDMRGHGFSKPTTLSVTRKAVLDDATSLIRHLGLERPVLVGHSLGGNLSQQLVRNGPNGFRALIVLDSAWNTGPLTRVERFLLRLAAPSLALIPARSLPRFMAGASATTAEARRDAERAFGQLSKAEFLEVWRATTAFIEPDPQYVTPVPLLLIRGAEDKTGNIAAAFPRWAQFEGMREHVIPEAGHIVSHDAPAAVSSLLLAFLSTLEDQD